MHMPLKFTKIGITTRSDISGQRHVLEKIMKIVTKAGATPLLDKKRCSLGKGSRTASYTSTRELDLLVTIGGDGTILRTVREMDDLSVPILSVNRGTLGFLTEISLHEMETMIPKFISGSDGVIDARGIIDISVTRGKKKILQGRVLNEAVISQGAIARLIDLETRVNGSVLATFHADGIIVATPTGSTAYSLAAGGPIVHPLLRATILTPINPHSFSQKPLLLPAEYIVDVAIRTKENKFHDLQVSLTLDGQTYVALRSGDIVTARLSKDSALFLRRRKETYFETLRNKLKWGERME